MLALQHGPLAQALFQEPGAHALLALPALADRVAYAKDGFFGRSPQCTPPGSSAGARLVEELLERSVKPL